jgi:hypothetical protein
VVAAATMGLLAQRSELLVLGGTRFVGAHLMGTNTPGTFNATGRTTTFSDFQTTLQQVCSAPVEVVWVATDQFLAAGLDPSMGVPLGIGNPGWEGANRVDITRALKAGLDLGDVADTVRSAATGSPSGPLSTFGAATGAARLAGS